jgi:ATP-dependent DNA helicase PIF1
MDIEDIFERNAKLLDTKTIVKSSPKNMHSYFTPFRIDYENVSPSSLKTPRKIGVSNDNWCDKKIKITESSIFVKTDDLSEDQNYAFEKFKRGDNLFITGPGGTGKTKLIQTLFNYGKSINKNIQVCALTGCAALLLGVNARTIHSWSGIRLAKGAKETIIANVLRNKNAVKLWKKIDILVCDEISMMSRKIFELLEEIARVIRKTVIPFGKIQIIFTGDFYQLPPVPTYGEPETGDFCFESPKWNEVFSIENHIELTTMFRQTDPKYIEILLQIRCGQLTEENKRILQSYVKREYIKEEHNGCVPTKLFAIRSKTDFINELMFSKLEGEEFNFKLTTKLDCQVYIDNNIAIPPELLSTCNKLSKTEKDFEIEQLTANSSCISSLSLKIGTIVMCTANIDMDLGICNGSQGVIINVTNTGPVVKFSNGVVYNMQPHFRQSEEYPTIAISQYPLCLAWAITIHKIQGATLTMAEMDIGQSVFEYGQTYVALSRIKSLDGLYLSAFHAQKIKTNPKVIEFYASFSGKK